ncbi:hypothetical protein As57867_022234, partial [Aphanomyces stellatus]
RGYLKIWPIVRACVYYQIWLQRANRTFRVDLTFKSPLEISLQAAGLIKLHLRQLLQDLPLKKGYIKVFNLLKQLSRDSWLKQFVLPDAVQDYAPQEPTRHLTDALARCNQHIIYAVRGRLVSLEPLLA